MLQEWLRVYNFHFPRIFIKKMYISLSFSILKSIVQFIGYTNARQWNPERMKIRFCTYMLCHTEIRNIFSRTCNFSSPLRQLLKGSNEFCHNYNFNYFTIFQYKQINQHTYPPPLPPIKRGIFSHGSKILMTTSYVHYLAVLNNGNKLHTFARIY